MEAFTHILGNRRLLSWATENHLVCCKLDSHALIRLHIFNMTYHHLSSSGIYVEADHK
jgi:hypothetical protein